MTLPGCNACFTDSFTIGSRQTATRDGDRDSGVFDLDQLVTGFI
jgi:hypothetical protein